MELLNNFLYSLIPIFVAIDAIGVLPAFFMFTQGLKKEERDRVATQSIITAFLVTVGFIFVGKAIFQALDIKVEDFMIAGGLVLLVIAVADILRVGVIRISRGATIGAVPLGTPLIAGPATLTTALILVGTQGVVPVILSVIVNILFAWVVFLQADRIVKIMGVSGSKAVAKVAALILAAIGIKMIRLGLTGIIK